MSDVDITINETIANIQVSNNDVVVQAVNSQTVNVDVVDSTINVDITNGAGPQGPAGPGVAVGGVAGDFLIKLSSTNYDTAWTSTIDLGTW
jgi:hypothetical protein